jgi:hypothetical protein
MRYPTGPLWGVGKGSIIVNVKFIEKDSRKELAESSFEGEIKAVFLEVVSMKPTQKLPKKLCIS